MQSLGDIGVIESITLKNFMCHQNLGPFQFGSNVNFIVGNNGSKCLKRFQQFYYFKFEHDKYSNEQENLGPLSDPNLDVLGGKSAILTALIVGLGGKATMTNRGVSLKGFVKNGEGLVSSASCVGSNTSVLFFVSFPTACYLSV